MEIEHINEDTIRVRINNTDLEARGYTFLDLLGNQEQIEDFFYSILDEVDLDNEFKESEAVTFQVIPHPNGLELLISKNPDLHENITMNKDLEELFLTTEDLDEDEQMDDLDLLELEEDDWKENQALVVKFSHFEHLIQLAQALKVINGFSSLYQYQENYYLYFQLTRDEHSLRTFDEKIALILEYGAESKLTSDILAEHAKLLIADNALESIFHYFK